MSDYEHIKGILKPTGKTIHDYVGEVPLKTYHESRREYFDDEFYRKAVEINGLVYEVESVELDPSDDIYRAKKIENGVIEFEVKFYNGGCSFSEAIDTALETVATPLSE